MREVLFRGKRVDNGEWVYGSLINNAFYKVKSREAVFYIFNPEDCEDAYSFEDFTYEYGYYEVNPETVSQFTGLLDKNGNKIFDGDIISVGLEYNYIVIFENGGFIAERSDKFSRLPLINNLKEIEIIGNIHEDGNK
ncbi:YopX family protein [Empedobacter brevis]|uniref:YopX family protein n=1 Tax=Empedobacter brevis TaxID=247 RepID=UPI0028B192B1|nr:YopX family protein [Empedobacter brevis]